MTNRRTKFYTDRQNGKFLGVCAGIADYTGLDPLLVRIGFVLVSAMGGAPWTIIAYFMASWLAPRKPVDLYEDRAEQQFWQHVRRSPKRSAREIRAKFRDIDRRLGEIETYYTTPNRRLADEIDALR